MTQIDPDPKSPGPESISRSGLSLTILIQTIHLNRLRSKIKEQYRNNIRSPSRARVVYLSPLSCWMKWNPHIQVGSTLNKQRIGVPPSSSMTCQYLCGFHQKFLFLYPFFNKIVKGIALLG